MKVKLLNRSKNHVFYAYENSVANALKHIESQYHFYRSHTFKLTWEKVVITRSTLTTSRTITISFWASSNAMHSRDIMHDLQLLLNKMERIVLIDSILPHLD